MTFSARLSMEVVDGRSGEGAGHSDDPALTVAHKPSRGHVGQIVFARNVGQIVFARNVGEVVFTGNGHGYLGVDAPLRPHGRPSSVIRDGEGHRQGDQDKNDDLGRTGIHE